jgi:REP element-mobilizing transposase RayT
MRGDLIRKSDLMAVCVMPDHSHLLLAPVKENLVDLIGRWKSYTTHLIRLKKELKSCGKEASMTMDCGKMRT